MSKTVADYCRMVDLSKVPQADWLIQSGFIVENLDNDKQPTGRQLGICKKIERNTHWHSSVSSKLNGTVHTDSVISSVQEQNLTQVRPSNNKIIDEVIQLCPSINGLSSDEILKNLKNTTMALHKYKQWVKEIEST
tara:strand:- start:78 stop:485 length:408 start_codon:yes stop_codon:yes gene_type:complete